MSATIAVLPARSGSKGIQDKNIVEIVGHPLIAYSIAVAKKTADIDRVIVSTDSEEYAGIARYYGAEVPFMRPKYLAADNTPMTPVLLHAVEKLNSLGIFFEIFVLRDCTVPFIDASDMKGAIKLLKKSNCHSIYGSVKAHPNPYFQMWELDKKGFLKISKTTNKTITRRQDAPIVYTIDGVFVFWTKKFLDTRKCESGKMLPYEISKEHGHMIDSQFDFKVAKLLLKHKKKA